MIHAHKQLNFGPSQDSQVKLINLIELKLLKFEFLVPGDRHSLFLCNEGHPRLIACGEDKIFDESTLTCEDYE